MPRELYVYYRAPAHQADRVQAAVTAMQDRLRLDVPGLQARLLRRTDLATGQDTWMETYALLPSATGDGVSPALGEHIEQLASSWQHLCRGPRHSEAFEPCA